MAPQPSHGTILSRMRRRSGPTAVSSNIPVALLVPTERILLPARAAVMAFLRPLLRGQAKFLNIMRMTPSRRISLKSCGRLAQRSAVLFKIAVASSRPVSAWRNTTYASISPRATSSGSSHKTCKCSSVWILAAMVDKLLTSLFDASGMSKPCFCTLLPCCVGIRIHEGKAKRPHEPVRAGSCWWGCLHVIVYPA